MHELIGLSGTFAGGKDTLAKKLEVYATHVSTGDIVRQEAMERYGSIERDVLQETANECRHAHGAGYFVDKAIRESGRPLVISGLRSLGEAHAILNAGGVIIYIDAPLEMRYERMKARARDNETLLTLEEFEAREQKEMFGDEADEAAFNIGRIRDLATVVIDNDSTLEEFYDKASEALNVEITV